MAELPKDMNPLGGVGFFVSLLMKWRAFWQNALSLPKDKMLPDSAMPIMRVFAQCGISVELIR